MPNSNLFLRATLTDRTSVAEDTLRVLCEYTDPADTPVTPPSTDFSLTAGNNFEFTINGSNIIRYIPKSDIATQTGLSLDLDLGSGNSLEILGITFPEVASAPALPSPTSKVVVYNNINIGQIAYDSSSIGNGSSLTFSAQYNGDPVTLIGEFSALPYINISWEA